MVEESSPPTIIVGHKSNRMNDTCLGINNEGLLVFDYYHEDVDKVDGANVYNGQNSTLWNNFREAFADEIKECYQNLRNKGKLTYDKVIEYFVTNGSDKWSASIYNEDADYKYISMLRSDGDSTYLYQVRGNGEAHLKYFIQNRLKYLDSKWYASDYADNYVSLRIYTPDEWAGIEPNSNITITPFSKMYAGVRYTANGTIYQKRIAANETTTFIVPTDETFNDTETAIYGASEISSLGDLAPLYCGTLNVSKANRLINLKVGDGTEGYRNTNLNTLSVGTNRLLKTIDVRNCPNLTNPLALTGCPNIEEIYATGSGITGVDLANSGYLRIAQLPRVTNLTLKNQLYIEDLTLEGYENVSTLNIENCPTIDELDILSKCTNIKRVRLTDVDWHFDDASLLSDLIEAGIKGVDENGLNVDIPQISGKCHIEELDGEGMRIIKDYFPYINITYTRLTTEIIYMTEDGSEELYRETIINGGDSTYGGAEQTKESTERYDYEFAGWSLTPNSEADENALKAVITNRVVYAAFAISTYRTYMIYMNHDGTQELYRETISNGGNSTYGGVTPTKEPSERYEYGFIGWSLEIGGEVSEDALLNVTTDRTVYAAFEITATRTYITYMSDLGVQIGEEAIINGGNANGIEATKPSTAQYNFIHIGWSLTLGGEVDENALLNVAEDRIVYAVYSSTLRSYTIRFLNGTTVLQSSVLDYGAIPVYAGEEPTHEDPEYVFEGWNPNIDVVTSDVDYQVYFRFTGSMTRKLLDGSVENYSNEIATNVRDYGFDSCKTLLSVDLPNATSVGTYAFQNCSNLTTVDLSNVTTIGDRAFTGCSSLTIVNLPNTTSIGARIFNNCSSLMTIVLPNVTTTGTYTFNGCSKLTTANLPSVKIVANYTFQNCSNLTTVDLSNASRIGTYVFSGCSKLTTLILRSETLCSLDNTNSFTNTLINSTSGNGYIYVPRALKDQYVQATNWSTYASKFRAIEDYPEICGGDN